MKIAVYYNLAYGGAKRAVREHVAGLMKLGHKLDVYTHDNQHDMFSPGSIATNEYLYEYRSYKIRIPIISRIVSDLQEFVLLKNLHKKIAQDIDSRGYDIVLVHTDTYTQSPFVLRFLKTKNVYYCLEPLRMVYEYSLRVEENLNFINKTYEIANRYIRKKIDITNARSAMNTLAISLFGREYMIHAYNLYPKISYLGVDENKFKPQKMKKKKQVLFVAEKEYIYGYDLAEAALKLIPEDKRPELKIVFGTKKSQRITDVELIKMYNESIVTLSLSRYDTFGLVPLESMACGTPVIALNVAGYRETILDGKTGFLVDFSPQEIAEKLMYFFNNQDVCMSMGDAGRDWVERKWTWDKQVKKLEKLLMKYAKN